MNAANAKRPKYIVLFRKPSEKNLSTMKKVLGAKERHGVSELARCHVLDPQRPGFSSTRVFATLGVAAGDLDEREKSTLEQSDEVELVVANELRSIPPTPPEVDVTSGEGRAPSPLEAYLQGMRDASDMALRFMRDPNAPTLPAPAPAKLQAAAAEDHSWCLDLIGLDRSYCRASGKDVTVAVLDTGIDLNHPDFAGVFTVGDNARSFISGESVQDGNGHGTHCAGVVGGPKRSQGGRRYGVAPDVHLLVGKVLSNAGSGWDDGILEGIQWAADSGARIISMSLGSPRAAGQPYNNLYERLAQRLAQTGKGVLFVAASGNDSHRPIRRAAVGNPAACPSFMAVAAVDRLKDIAYFSNAGLDSIGEVNVSAPGVSVYSSYTGSGYRSISGTSMATPHVAGIAALYLELDITLTPGDLWTKLESSVLPLGSEEDYGKGLAQVP